jgi:hypothetical protein
VAAKLTLQEELVRGETIAILPADPGQLEMYSRMGEIPKDVWEALIKAMHLKNAMLDTERQMQAQQQELADITQEQLRIRANMGTVSQTSQYCTTRVYRRS